MKITSDSSALYSIAQGEAIGVGITPLVVTIDGKHYREFEEIDSKEFLERIHKGSLPKSSQPSPGELVEMWERFEGEEIIHISMADGLSSSYNTATSIKHLARNERDITIVNSKTLCGPHRHIVTKAARMARDGMNAQAILDSIQEDIASARSFLIPYDFDYLRRGGRLNPLKAYTATLLRLIPVVAQSADGRHLETIATCRRFRDVAEVLKKRLHKAMREGVSYVISVSHAENPERANFLRDAMAAAFPLARLEMFELSPAFITQGGPGCVSLQMVRE